MVASKLHVGQISILGFWPWYVSSACGCKFGHSNGIHVRAPAEMVGEMENVGVSVESIREGANTTDADCDAWRWRQCLSH